MDAIAILVSLTQRVTRLERDNPYRPSKRKPIDPATAALLDMHRKMRSTEDREVEAITEWLKTPTKKNAPSTSGRTRLRATPPERQCIEHHHCSNR